MYTDLLSRLPRELHARAKAVAHVTTEHALEWDSGDLHISVTNPVLREIGPGIIETTVMATRAGKPITIDNPCQFANPPLEHGEREDVKAAFRAMVEGVVAFHEARQ